MKQTTRFYGEWLKIYHVQNCMRFFCNTWYATIYTYSVCGTRINTLLHSGMSRSKRSDNHTALKGHFSPDCSSANILNIVCLWNRINRIEYRLTNHVDSSFDHKVTSSIIILDSHWELQFSKHEKGPKSEKNAPPPLSEGWLQAWMVKWKLIIRAGCSRNVQKPDACGVRSLWQATAAVVAAVVWVDSKTTDTKHLVLIHPFQLTT